MFARRQTALVVHRLVALAFASCMLLSLVLTPGVARASEKAPEGYKNGRLFRNGGPVPILTTGNIRLVSETYGYIECTTNAYGSARNELIGSETRAAGEVEAWNAFNCTSPYLETLEQADKKQLEKKEIPCATQGATIGEGKCLTVFVTAEMPLEPEEGKTLRRNRSSLPWKAEVLAREHEGERSFFLRTGLHALGETATAATTESGTCYPTEERVRGTVTPANWRAVPSGCILLNVVFPQIPTEVVVYGSQEPLIIDGAKNGLYPSKLEFNESGRLFSSEGAAGTDAELAGALYGDGAITLELITIK
jgi:hypothetical protein